jgi:hypothetical protein
VDRECSQYGKVGFVMLNHRKRPLYRFRKREDVLQRLCKMLHVFVLTNRSILFQRQTNLVLSVIVFNLHFYISAHLHQYIYKGNIAIVRDDQSNSMIINIAKTALYHSVYHPRAFTSLQMRFCLIIIITISSSGFT